MNTIPIFLASDDNYAPFIATTSYSILDNTKSHIDFYILDGGITKESKDLITKSLDCFTHYSLEYIDMLAIGLEDLPDNKRFTRNTLSRFFIPTVKPNISKALYLDVDIIVRGDIAELYNQDLEGYPLGAVTEDYSQKISDNLRENVYPNYKGGLNYFNAGVLLLDCDYFRKNNILDTLLSTTNTYADRLTYPDQDVLNIVFDCNFKKLDYQFNLILAAFDRFKSKYPDCAEKLKQEALLWHYAGPKPWEAYYNEGILFWNYVAKTTFRDFLIKKYLPEVPKVSKARLYRAYFLSKITFGAARTKYAGRYKKLCAMKSKSDLMSKIRTLATMSN